MNTASVIVCIILVLLIVLAVCKIIKDRKNGKLSCGGNCESCAMRGSCEEHKTR